MAATYIERLIGTLRRECLDHMVVFNEASLYRHVELFMAYYHESRVHLSLAKDTPEPRPVHRPELGPVVATPLVGGLHHRYERRGLNVGVLAAIPLRNAVRILSGRYDMTIGSANRSEDFLLIPCSRGTVERAPDLPALCAGLVRSQMGLSIGTG